MVWILRDLEMGLSLMGEPYHESRLELHVKCLQARSLLVRFLEPRLTSWRVPRMNMMLRHRRWLAASSWSLSMSSSKSLVSEDGWGKARSWRLGLLATFS